MRESEVLRPLLSELVVLAASLSDKQVNRHSVFSASERPAAARNTSATIWLRLVFPHKQLPRWTNTWLTCCTGRQQQEKSLDVLHWGFVRLAIQEIPQAYSPRTGWHLIIISSVFKTNSTPLHFSVRETVVVKNLAGWNKVRPGYCSARGPARKRRRRAEQLLLPQLLSSKETGTNVSLETHAALCRGEEAGFQDTIKRSCCSRYLGVTLSEMNPEKPKTVQKQLLE